MSSPPRSGNVQAGRPPSKWLLLTEGRAFYELAATWLLKPWLRKGPKGDGHPVMVLPGYAASGLSTRPLRTYLEQRGLEAIDWGLGRNLGPRPGFEEQMLDRLAKTRQQSGRKVSLVGWSLGGVYARLLANRAPENVRSVITLGSPFLGDPKANYSWRVMEMTSGTRLDEVDDQTMDDVRRTPPVPTTCVYTRGDGITAWQCCVDQESDRCENIEIAGSHCGLGVNPLALWVIADRLLQPEGAWRPFKGRRATRQAGPRPSTQPSGI